MAAAWGSTLAYLGELATTDNVMKECVNLYNYQIWRQRLESKTPILLSKSQCREVCISPLNFQKETGWCILTNNSGVFFFLAGFGARQERTVGS